MKKQAVLGDRAWTWDQPEHDLSWTLHQTFLWNLISTLLKETSPVPDPVGHWWPVSHSWGSRGQRCPGAAGGTPHPMDTFQSHWSALPVLDFQQLPTEKRHCPSHTTPTFVWFYQRWSEVERPWHRAGHGQVKNPSTDIIPVWSLCMSCAVAAQLKKHLVLTHRRVRKEQRGKQAKSFPALSIRQGPGLVEGNFWTNYLLSMKQHLFLL